MKRALLRIAIIAAATCALAACAQAGVEVGAIAPLPDSSGIPSDPKAGTFLPATAIEANVPAGFTSFCIRFADQCAVTPDMPRTVALTDQYRALLSQVNHHVNDTIWPMTDRAHYGRAEYWTIPTDGYGDCEDIALTKRKQLADAGLSLAALRIAVVVTPRREWHAVLTVATDKGDYVLDSLSDEVQVWSSTSYVWVERQDPAAAQGWASLAPKSAPLLAMNGGIVTTAASSH